MAADEKADDGSDKQSPEADGVDCELSSGTPSSNRSNGRQRSTRTKSMPSAAKSRVNHRRSTARLKPCPESARVQAGPFLKVGAEEAVYVALNLWPCDFGAVSKKQ